MKFKHCNKNCSYNKHCNCVFECSYFMLDYGKCNYNYNYEPILSEEEEKDLFG